MNTLQTGPTAISSYELYKYDVRRVEVKKRSRLCKAEIVQCDTFLFEYRQILKTNTEASNIKPKEIYNAATSDMKALNEVLNLPLSNDTSVTQFISKYGPMFGHSDLYSRTFRDWYYVVNSDQEYERPKGAQYVECLDDIVNQLDRFKYCNQLTKRYDKKTVKEREDAIAIIFRQVAAFAADILSFGEYNELTEFIIKFLKGCMQYRIIKANDLHNAVIEVIDEIKNDNVNKLVISCLGSSINDVIPDYVERLHRLLINAGLESIKTILLNENGVNHDSLKADCLMGNLYYELMLAASNNMVVKQCAHVLCNAFILGKNNGKPEYCPPNDKNPNGCRTKADAKKHNDKVKDMKKKAKEALNRSSEVSVAEVNSSS